jgi:hypothetical protein
MCETQSVATRGHRSLLLDIKWAKIALRHQLLALPRGTKTFDLKNEGKSDVISLFLFRPK